ncbi:MAG: MTH1187 family thiamine-binding protein [Euryarchaeota archaeon]|nr:MTH1187 family thiamine-binding protein [Euryarchaeota archaeon]
MIIAQLTISPVGKGISLSSYVKKAIESIENEHITFQTHAMGTIIEAPDLETLFRVVTNAHNAVLNAGAKRVITELKIDDRRDKQVTMASKLTSLKK